MLLVVQWVVCKFLQFVSNFPNKAKIAIPIACTSSHSAQNIAFNELGRQSIMADSNWNEETISTKYFTRQRFVSCKNGCSYYLSYQKMDYKKNLEENYKKEIDLKFGFDADFQIESYLRYQGSVFVDRFDANSYLIYYKSNGLF